MNPRIGTRVAGRTAGRVPAYVRGVRQAGLFFLVFGIAGISGYLIPGSPGYHHTAVLAILVGVLAVGGLTRTRMAFWLSGHRSLVIPTVGLTSVAVCNADRLLSPVPLGVYFIVVFLWIGQWHRPGTALRFMPVAGLAYLLPYAVGAPNHNGEVASSVLVLAASVMVAEVVARQTQSALRARARQSETLDLMSVANRTDDLTGLGNRRLGNQLLEELTGGDAIIILDVDRFKTINDTYGHIRGDQLLQELGAFLRSEAADLESIARMGGEEFMLVIKQVPAETALVVANRLVNLWRRTGPLATISAGVAVHVDGHGPSTTYAKADAALYQAKGLGRDRVILAD